MRKYLHDTKISRSESISTAIKSIAKIPALFHSYKKAPALFSADALQFETISYGP